MRTCPTGFAHKRQNGRRFKGFSALFRPKSGVYIQSLSDGLLVSLITVQEAWNGWATAIARARTPDQLALGHSRLAGTLNELRNWTVVPLSAAAIARYERLKRQKLNVGGNDLRIAATALELGATVVTRNRRDFARIPGVVLEDWSV